MSALLVFFTTAMESLKGMYSTSYEGKSYLIFILQAKMSML